MTRVLPLPAPATISSGPSTWEAAWRCGSVRPSNIEWASDALAVTSQLYRGQWGEQSGRKKAPEKNPSGATQTAELTGFTSPAGSMLRVPTEIPAAPSRNCARDRPTDG